MRNYEIFRKPVAHGRQAEYGLPAYRAERGLSQERIEELRVILKREVFGEKGLSTVRHNLVYL